MMKREAEALHISRLLTPEHRTALLALVRRAYREENPQGRSLPRQTEDHSSMKSQEYSCKNAFEGGKG